MTNTRFTVETAVVDQFGDDFVGWYIRDSFTLSSVRDGKGKPIHVYASQVSKVWAICEEMNERTEGITFGESDVQIPRGTEVLAA